MGDKVARVRRKIGKKALQHLLDLDAVTERLKVIASGGGERAPVVADLVTLLEARPERPWGE
ncbi:hypothetical protein [Haliangium sp.]|uniref:hypothetical protein n=1 Tax=Haliangium sp. TaxID=2663208 RepID=UPI003D0A466A